MQGTMPGARRRGRPRTAWIDNIKSWTGLSVEESIRMTEDRDKWSKYVRVAATLGSRTAKEQNRTGQLTYLSVTLTRDITTSYQCVTLANKEQQRIHLAGPEERTDLL